MTIRPASEALARSFVELSDTHYASEPVNDLAYVRWRHLENPLGPSIACELVSGEAVVGRTWVQNHEWSVLAREVRAANPFDFLIREDHRSMPAFLTVFRESMKQAEKQADFVYHTSNPITDDLYQRLLKLRPVTELDGAVLPVRPFATAAAGGLLDARSIGRLGDAVFSTLVGLGNLLGRASGLTFSDSATAEEQEKAVERFVSDEEICARRTPAYRSWRYRGGGPIAYEQRWIRRRGKVIGYVVTSDRDLNGVRGRFVVDLVLPGRKSWPLIATLWLKVAAEAAVSRRDAVFFFYNRENRGLKALARLPLITVARSRLPQRIPIFVRVPDESGDADLAGTAWSKGYFVLSDFDLL